jgi:cyclophilin family peptidyl-prolyl cis-trans isomerase
MATSWMVRGDGGSTGATGSFLRVATDKRERQRANRQLKEIELAKQEQRRRMTRRGLLGGLLVVGGLALVIAIAAIGGAFSGDDDDSDDVSTATSQPVTSEPVTSAAAGAPVTVTPETLPAGETPCPEADGSSPRVISFGQAPPTCIEDDVTYTAEVATSHGDFTIELDQEAAPATVNNFVVLARYHYFDNTVCHRAITGFMVQCGDPTGTGSGDPGYEFANENPASNADYTRGAVAMANSGPDTNGSQFFVTTSDSSPSLETSYSLFGQVTDGLDTTIAALDALGSNPAADNGVPPSEQIVVESVTITES